MNFQSHDIQQLLHEAAFWERLYATHQKTYEILWACAIKN